VAVTDFEIKLIDEIRFRDSIVKLGLKHISDRGIEEYNRNVAILRTLLRTLACFRGSLSFGIEIKYRSTMTQLCKELRVFYPYFLNSDKEFEEEEWIKEDEQE
jgi:hypothetical protein